MSPKIMPVETARLVALVELEVAQLASDTPTEGLVLGTSPTEIFDISGPLLFRRFPVAGPEGVLGYIDIAAHPELGGPYLAHSFNTPWHETRIERCAAEIAGLGSLPFSAKFLCHSYPKVSVELAAGGRRRRLVEWGSWSLVSPKEPPEKYLPGRGWWSLLREIRAGEMDRGVENFERSLETYRSLFAEILHADKWTELLAPSALRQRVGSLDVQASGSTCMELVGQIVEPWCVPTSLQMMLTGFGEADASDDDQQELAQLLGQGSVFAATWLALSSIGLVEAQAEATYPLEVQTVASPSWDDYAQAVSPKTPAIDVITGHARAIAETKRVDLPTSSEKRLVVFDPLPLLSGSVREENFDAPPINSLYLVSGQVAQP